MTESGWIFVGGCPRSGTTMMAQLLYRHAEVVVGAERYLRRIVAGEDLAPEHFADERFLSIEEGDTYYGEVELHRRHPDLTVKLARARWKGEKTPYLDRRVAALRTRFPGARILLMVRNVFAVAASYQARADDAADRTWEVSRGALAAVEEWSASLAATELACASGEDVWPVSLEMFLAHPEGDRALLAFLGLPDDEELSADFQAQRERFAAGSGGQRLDGRMSFEVARRADHAAYRRLLALCAERLDEVTGGRLGTGSGAGDRIARPVVTLEMSTSWLHRNRRPVGITRVEQEVARALLGREGVRSRFVVWDAAAAGFRCLPHAAVDALIAGRGAAEVESATGGTLPDRLAHLPLLEIGAIDVLLLPGFFGCGADALGSLFLAHRSHSLRVVGWIYDTVPWRHPELTQDAVAEHYLLMLHLTVWASSELVAISSTARDAYLELAAEVGLPARELRSMRLGSQLATARRERPRRDLPDEFVLMVGTLEPRKNHDLAYRVWRRLAWESPETLVPLVWVGQSGWGTDDLVRRVTGDPLVHPRWIHHLEDCDDAELAWLYENCLFTIYPSSEEGWGLPVVESLSFGKPCLVGDCAALREAARGLATHLDPLDGAAWAREVTGLLDDRRELASRSARIRSRFQPTRWPDAAAALLDELALGRTPGVTG